MGRAPCCDKANVKRGPWSPEEDTALKNYVEKHGTGGNWIALPHKAGLKRCGKSCRLRWLNYLRPDIKHGGFTEEEDNIICNLYKTIGSRWSVIASHLPGRTDNDVKNYWNTKLKKKMMGKNTLTSTNNSSSSSISINDNIQFNSTPSHPVCPTKAEIVDYDFSSFLINTNSATQPLSTGGGYGQNVGSNSNRLVSDPTHFSLPGLMEPSEFGTSTNNSYSVSSSQEFSGLSVSSSLGMDNSYGSWSGNGGDGDENGFLMDLGFGVPYDLLNLFGFQEENSDVLTPNLAKSPYTHLLANVCETKPQGLYQSVTHY